MAIATLIAAGRLDERLLADALEQLGEARFIDWVEPGSAADVKYGDGPRAARRALANLSGVDCIVHPPGPREKRLLIADMDSTMIGQECIDELADYAGVREAVAGITERAMQGELDFAGALRERVGLLRGLDEQVITRCLAERISPTAGAATLVRTMRARSATTILVSGGFTAFVGPIAEVLGFEGFEANVLGVCDGRLSGLTEGRVVDSQRKAEVLVEARERLGLRQEETLAIGDGANDMAMIAEAGLGVAYRAKPALAAVADGYLDHNPLDALLWVQGIPKSEWVVG